MIPSPCPGELMSRRRGRSRRIEAGSATRPRGTAMGVERTEGLSLKHLAENLFEGSPSSMVMRLIDEKELKIDVYRSGGKGGQSVNTTDSAVRVTHLPTGITVAIQNERSQLQNRETAMTILRSRLAQLQLEQHRDQLSELKGPNQSAEWGNQIRSYVLHPYKQVKDLRTRYETSDPDKVLDGDLDPLINAYLEYSLSSNA